MAEIGANEPAGALTLSNFPNPFTGSTTFAYTLPEPASIKISLTDIFGREIAIVTNGEQSQGEHTHSFALTDIPRGVCFVRFLYGDENNPRFTRKLIVQ
jgi:hypothetical protein